MIEHTPQDRISNLESRLNRIIEWVKYYYNKTSDLLTIAALVLTILLAGDYIMNGMQSIVLSAYDPKLTKPSVAGIIAITTFILAIVSLVVSLFYCIKVVEQKQKKQKSRILLFLLNL